MIDEALRRRLIDMARLDLECRERLAAAGELGDGYHPEMQAVHEANAAALDDIIGRHGWPGRSGVGEDGAESAWLIAQHAIALPDFQRSCRLHLESAVEQGEAAPWQLAYLSDRIRFFEGEAQVYGTHFDWDETGEMSPLPIADADQVDARRAAVGLPPLAETLEAQRKAAAREPKPRDLAQRRRGFEAWARRVGWRS